MRRHYSASALAALALAASLALGACSDTSTDSGGDSLGAVAMSFPSREVTIWNETLDVMEQVVTAAGYEFLTDNPAWDIQTQVNDWQTWIQRGDVKAIMGFPAQADSFIAVTAEASAAGIPVIGYSAPWEGTAEYIELDLKGAGLQVGEAAAAWLAETYPNERVGVGLLADTTADLGRVQAEGLAEGLAAANVDIYDLEVNSREQAYNAAQSALVAHPEIRVWVAISGDMVLGARQATIDAGYDELDFYGGATDASEEGYQHILDQDSMIREAFCFTPDTLGQAMGEVLVAAAKGEDIPHAVVGVTRVDASNAANYL